MALLYKVYQKKVPIEQHIFGAEWDGSSNPAWTRTDDSALFSDPNPYYVGMSGEPSSPFDNHYPWAGMGIVDMPETGTLVRIPKYWYKWTRTGAKMKLQIANYAADGFLVSPAHADRGDGKGERDVVFVARYHCDSAYKSTTDTIPLGNVSRPNFRANIHNLGPTIWQYDFALLWTINMLFLVEYANWNCQTMIGFGCGNDSSVEKNGATDPMPYQTGTMTDRRNTYGHVQYRYIEDLWANVMDWCDGITFSETDVYCKNNPADYSDSSLGTKVGVRPTTSSYISAWNNPTTSGYEYALYPSAVNGSYSTYVCDDCSYYSRGKSLSVGGYYMHTLSRGLFHSNGISTSASAYDYIGGRLQKLP
jgi:hypothetical protein